MVEKEPKDWRELLGWIANDPAGMQRLVQSLGVRDITIRRWVKKESDPRPQNLRRLLIALPEYRERFIELIPLEFEDFADFTLDDPHQEIPPKFYTQIFQMRGNVGPTQLFWSLTDAILGQALDQLDPEHLGMAITVVKCMIAARPDHKILSLRQSVGQASAPWPGNLEQTAMFLGAESLAGYVVSTCHPSEVQNYKEDNEALPGHQLDHEVSAAAHPILYAGRVAGCLLVSSTEPDYFMLPGRLNLVADYAHLISLAFAPADFVDPTHIELRLMPPHSEQRSFFSTFRKRITEARLKLYGQHNVDAEQYVWEGLERDILKLPENGDSLNSVGVL
ncbi:MAG TPA: GAF domain-containing protein [Ktedonobacteraceae bacterium]